MRVSGFDYFGVQGFRVLGWVRSHVDLGPGNSASKQKTGASLLTITVNEL